MFLFYITDRKQLAGTPEGQRTLLLARIRAAAMAGIDAIQLREKDLTARELVELGCGAAEIIRETNSSGISPCVTKLLINSRVDIAIACGADGVHLRSDDISAAEARSVFVQAGVAQPVIAVSCHTVNEVELAEGSGAEFAVFGPVFEKSGTAARAAGISELRRACQQRRAAKPQMPVLALSGVDLDNAAQCMRAGASGIAAIRLFQSADVAETVSSLRKLRI